MPKSEVVFDMYTELLYIAECTVVIEKGLKQKARQRSSSRFGGAKFVQFLAALAVCFGQFERNG